jgi:hypothetical protein
MKRAGLWLLGGLVTACSQPGGQLAEVPLKHQHDAAYEQQVQLLQADKVTLGSAHPVESGLDFYVLHVQVLNPKNQPEVSDSLRQRVRRLARIVVADLANPSQYRAVNVDVNYKKGLFSFGNTNASQSFIYPLASLQ